MAFARRELAQGNRDSVVLGPIEKSQANNSFDRSGMSEPFIASLGTSADVSRPVNSGVRAARELRLVSSKSFASNRNQRAV